MVKRSFTFRFVIGLLLPAALGALSACNPLGGGAEGSAKDPLFHPGYSAPTIPTFRSMPGLLRGGQLLNVSFSLPTRTVAAKLEFSSDGGTTYSFVSALLPTDTSYAWSVPEVDTTLGQLKLTVTHEMGQINEQLSSGFIVDSTAPGAPAVSLSSANPSSSVVGALTVSDCEDRAAVFVSESASTPSESAFGWQPCTAQEGAIGFRLSSADGAKTLYVHAKDEAGNVTSSSSVMLVLDRTAPSLAWNASPIAGEKIKGGLNYSLSWILSDEGTGVDALSLYYAADGVNYFLASTLATDATSHSWSVPLDHVATARVKLFATDRAGNVQTLASDAFSVDSVAPVISFGSPVGAYRGGSTLALSFTATDSLSGMSSLMLQYASDGVSFSDVTALTLPATSSMWTIPSHDVTTARLRLVGVDLVGNTTVVTTTAFTIDSTAPATPAVNLASGNPTSSTAAQLTVASCSDRARIHVSESASIPAPDAPGWQTCVTTVGGITHTVSSEDGTKTLYVFAQDSVGNRSNASTLEVTLDRTAPAAPAIVFSSSQSTSAAHASMSSTFTVASCMDRAKILITESGSAPSSDDPAWQSCVTTSGGITYTLSSSSEGARSLRAWAMDGASNISAAATTMTLTYDRTPPQVTWVEINNGALNVSTPFVTVALSATDTYSPLKVRLQESDSGLDCQTQYADDSWVSYSGVSQTYSFQISTGDGTKKICVWGKDGAGNVSMISPSAGVLGVDMDTIEYFVGNPPQVTTLNVANDRAGANFGTQTYVSGDAVNISWTITDAEGLADQAVTLHYTTDNTNWTEIPGSYGSTTGNPKTYSGSFAGWNAPGSGYFRIKILAFDVSGNTSLATLSNTQNTSPWTVWAGTTDRGVGGTGKSALLLSSTGGDTPLAAVNPKTNDIYAIDSNFGLRKLDAKTGIVSTFIAHGTLNLGTSGTLTSSSRLNLNGASQVAFDSNGLLYVSHYGGNPGNILYQVDPATLTYRLYLGGGTGFDENATPSSIYLMGRMSLAFDDQNSLYFFTNCTPTTFVSSSPSSARLMKVAQDPGGAPGALTRVYGNCVNASVPSSGAMDPLTTNTPAGSYLTGGVAPFNGGSSIYFWYGGGSFKILDGVMYRSSVSVGKGMTYNPFDGKIYQGNNNVSVWTLNLSGQNGDTSTLYAGGGTAAGCFQDGTLAIDACLTTNGAPLVTPQGKILILDGAPGGNSKPYRVRYIDTGSRIQTLFGSLPFYGEGLDKSLMRGNIQGLHWKSADEPNQAAFPAGLYFTEADGKVLGRIDPSTGLVSLSGGGQWGSAPAVTNGTPITSAVSFGGSAQVDLTGLGFDTDGLPWMKNNDALLRIDQNGQALVQQTKSSSSSWQAAPDGADPRLYGLFYGGGRANMTMLGTEGLFLIGSGGPSVGLSSIVSIRYFDFMLNRVTRVMGDYAGQSANAVTPDRSTPGSAVDSSISNSCANTANCYMVYRADQDRLYFTERTSNIRYIANPTNPSISTLGTLFTTATTVHNFVFSMDRSQVFYVDGSGQLRCRDISSGKSWCNDTQLGPTSGMSRINETPNQFAWKDSSTLLVSTGGQIYQYSLPQ